MHTGASSEPTRESFDAIVVGSGIGGLVAASLFARAGMHVLVAERHDRPGGYAHAFERDGRLFDAAVHMTSTARDGFLHRILRAVGSADRCNFIELDPIYTSVFPGLTVNVAAGLEGFIESHARQFPDERDGLMGFLRICSKVNAEVVALPPESPWDESPPDAEAYPFVCKYLSATVGDVLDEHVKDERLKSVLGSLWLYQGLPPSQLSFVYFATMFISYLTRGAFYCEGSYQQLADAFVESVTANGGQVLLNADVERIVVEGGVRGVVLEGGIRVSAPLVVSNVDALQTYERLVGVNHLPPGFVDGIRRLQPSLSAVVLYLATDLELDSADSLAHEVFLFDDWDHDAVFRRLHEPVPSALSLSIPTKVDPSLAPPGEHVVSLVAPAPYRHGAFWEAERTMFQNAMIARAEQLLPGLGEHVTVRVGGNPWTLERFTRNYRGAMYGWANFPAQAIGYRPRHRTPVAGLFLAGHWTQPGGGVMGAVISGVQTAQLVLDEPDAETMLARLAEGSLSTSGAATPLR